MTQSLYNSIAFDDLINLRIRPMQLADLKPVHQIDTLSFTMPWPESAFRYELVENPRSQLWVAELPVNENEDQIVGAIITWLIMDEAHIATLAVHPDHRKKGIGARLVATALREAMQAGAILATLEVRAGNIEAQRLYQRFNFQIVGRRTRYYQDNHEDALLMTLLRMDETYLQFLEKGEWQKPCVEAGETRAGNLFSGS